MAITDFESLLAVAPMLHRDGQGGRTSWALPDDVLRFINNRVQPGWTTLETGIGVSTLVFALTGARHTAIAHHSDEVENVRQFAHEQQISLANVHLVNDRSERALPSLLDAGPLDLVLIDGRHAFPSPFVDWYFTVDRLVVGGLMVVDDLHLKTGAILAEFMTVDHRFSTVATFAKTAVFAKLEGDVNIGEFDRQPWMLAVDPPTSS